MPLTEEQQADWKKKFSDYEVGSHWATLEGDIFQVFGLAFHELQLDSEDGAIDFFLAEMGRIMVAGVEYGKLEKGIDVELKKVMHAYEAGTVKVDDFLSQTLEILKLHCQELKKSDFFQAEHFLCLFDYGVESMKDNLDSDDDLFNNERFNDLAIASSQVALLEKWKLLKVDRSS